MYLENASGATADRPELLRLLKDARKGDVLLVESIDRLSRLPVEDWQKLKAAIDSKGLRIVALANPLTYVVDGLRALMIQGARSEFGLATDIVVLVAAMSVAFVIAARLYPRMGH